ncbi:MAG TPA: carbohydrate ABC transporter permease [Gaiellales bacterium]|jgi:multiple sugar transport system permease protein|nr:carbohydrate ABC transporter permease [Gaiellales bacterium]
MAVAQQQQQTLPAEAARQRWWRRRPRRRRGDPLWVKLFVYAVLIVGGVVFMAPWAWMVVASFKHLSEMFSWPPTWVPHNPTLSNYTRFLQSENVWRWFANSAFVTGTIVTLQTFFAALAAYCYAKRTFPLRETTFIMGLGTLAVPAAVFLIPNYLVLKHIPLFGGNDVLGQGGHGWLDSYWGLIVPNLGNMVSIFLLRQYMRTIPDELIDAAKIDGAGHFRIFWKIVLPLSRPAVAACAIFAFNFYWNDFLGPLIIISSSDHYTVPLGLALFVVKNRTAWDLVMAGSVLATLPVLIVFLAFQRHFVRGISISGLK